MNADPLAASREEFDRFRQRRAIQDVLAKLRGEPMYLLPFEEVREKLRLDNPAYRGLQEVQLHHIIGSFARYNDFTRAFLPRNPALRDRWATVHRLTGKKDLPPVELHRVGNSFFVSDGHHRISVALQTQAQTIKAHVYEYHTSVPLEPETTFGELMIKEQYLQFLKRTGLDESRPEQCIQFTSLGQYSELECQIALYQDVLSTIDGRPFSYEEAAIYWYDMYYTPILQIIRQEDLLRGFPGRTEADLFVWVTAHQKQLSEAYGYDVPINEVTDHGLAHHTIKWPRRLMLNIKERLLGQRRTHHPHV